MGKETLKTRLEKEGWTDFTILLSHIDPDSVEEAFKQEYDIETHKTA